MSCNHALKTKGCILIIIHQDFRKKISVIVHRMILSAVMLNLKSNLSVMR